MFKLVARTQDFFKSSAILAFLPRNQISEVRNTFGKLFIHAAMVLRILKLVTEIKLAFLLDTELFSKSFKVSGLMRSEPTRFGAIDAITSVYKLS